MSEAKKTLKMGMVGGGPGAFIGPVHRMAAELDGRIRLVAGAFSQDAEKSRQAGLDYGIDPDRAYSSYEAMIEAESRRSDAIDLVSIVTPNHLHLPVARAALEAGLHVISDKPATSTLAEALELKDIVERTGLCYALTFTYTGYPMVRAARDIIQSGQLGTIRKVMVEYLQGWLSQPIEQEGQKQALWRSDPAKAGLGGCIGDIGVHAFNLLEYVTQLQVDRLCADLRSIVTGRALDDDCTILATLKNGAQASIAASQIAAGERNNLRLRVYGDKGGLEWQQESPTKVTLRWLNGSETVLHTGSSEVSAPAKAATRLPLGHPEGLIEAFANIYKDFAASVAAHGTGRPAPQSAYLCGIEEAVRSMAFVQGCVREGRSTLHWQPLPSRSNS